MPQKHRVFIRVQQQLLFERVCSAAEAITETAYVSYYNSNVPPFFLFRRYPLVPGHDCRVV